MSASTERKNRIAAREAGTDKKTLAALEEEKKKATSKRRWTWGTIGVIVLIAAILILNSGVLYTASTALTVGGEKYSPAEVNYYYGSEYMNMANYLSYFGVDTTLGLRGLSSQECSWTDGGTWRDYFRDMAKNDVHQTQALLNYAKENGITLTEEEIAEVDANFEGIEFQGLRFCNIGKHVSIQSLALKGDVECRLMGLTLTLTKLEWKDGIKI